jgi:hypothetical protein
MFTLILLGVLSFNMIVLAEGDRQTIDCSQLVNEVAIDGKWTHKDEWSDSSRHSLFFWAKEGEGDLRAKYDDNFLYILIDYFTDVEKQQGDFAGIIIDPHHDFGDTPQTDDFLLQCFWESSQKYSTGVLKWRGGDPRGLNWRDAIQIPSGVEVSSSDDAVNDPVDKELHKTYEFKIPRNLMGYPSIGFVAFTGDGQAGTATSTWPAGSGEKNLFDDPSQWGELTFITTQEQTTLKQTTSGESFEATSTTAVLQTGESSESYVPGGYLAIAGLVIVVAVVLGVLLLKGKR